MILVVEDSDIDYELFLEALPDGSQAVQARDSDAAFNQIDSGDVSVAVIDMKIPGGRSGADVAAYAIEHGVPAALLTTAPNLASILGPVGVEVYRKPEDLPVLLSWLSEVLDARIVG